MSELHNRLAHLVNYSSQLIFVSGNSAAEQQRILNSFLASQQENTEISFFNASTTQNDSDYRAIICRQLADHTVGSFVRSLSQLLAVRSQGDSQGGLSPKSGPYLVCITQAECLGQSFLQELWDWVMHAQQNAAGVHLNIILFGESKWAKESQLWLPSQNSHKPVLLSSELVDPIGFDVHALEALMADKRSWFGMSNRPLVATKWFIGSVLSIFFIVFIGLMSWQYPQQTKALFTYTDDLPSSINKQTNHPEIIFKTEESRVPIADDEDLSLNVPNKHIPKLQIERIEGKTLYDDKNVISSNTIPESNTNESPSPTFTDTVLVSSWSQEAKIESPDSGDFQVPDIISVEQLDSQFAFQQTQRLEQLSLGNQKNNRLQLSASIESTVAALNTQEMQVTSAAPIDYNFDETTLLALPSEAIVLQLSGIQNPIVLENYLSDNNLKSETWVYQTQRYGGPWYVVLYKHPFDSIDDALLRITDLPQDVRESQPFAKSIKQIQQEISLR